MGISRDKRHKRRLTGGRMACHKKKRSFEKARPVSMTRLSADKRIRPIRTRGGNSKFRALRLNQGNYSWASQGITHTSKILDVVYNATNNELVRTKTLVKNAIVTIDATPFKAWYQKHYGVDLSKKSGATQAGKKETTVKLSRHVQKKHVKRVKADVVDPKVAE